MSIWDQVNHNPWSMSTPEPSGADEMPKRIFLSPLPRSIRGMEKRPNVDRLGMMSAGHIGFGGPSFGPDQPGFWEYQGRTKDEYLEMASHIPEIRDRLDKGESLENLMHDERLGDCARQYFGPDHMIRIEPSPDGRYEYSAGGSHRIAAAQELGLEIPVQINEFGRKDNYGISIWEKQERYHALIDYMHQHNYGEADREKYESDPEWQRLHEAYMHPINDWEKSEPAEWEQAANDFLERRSQDLHTPDEVSFEEKVNNPAGHDIDDGPHFPPPPPPDGEYKNDGTVSLIPDRFQSSYADRIRQTPSPESNRWAGERGESVCAPQSDDARKIMESRGISGVQYQNGIPDFSPFSESTVKLGYMTDERHSRGLTDGRDNKDTIYAHFDDDGNMISAAHRPDRDSMADLHMKYDRPGNFEQADILTAEQWSAERRDGKEWTAADVKQYREDNGLTWHECNDMETMQMIPEAINADFGHLGGVGEVKETRRMIDEALQDHDEGKPLTDEDFDRMCPEELDSFERDFSKGYYDDDGAWNPYPPLDAPPKEEFIPDDIHDTASAGPDNGISEKAYAVPDEGSVNEQIAEPVKPSVDDPAGEPVDRLEREPAEEHFNEPVSEIDNESVEESAEKSIENPLDEPAEEPIDEPVDEPIDGPVDEPVEEPIDEPIDEPVDEPVDEPLNEPVD